MEETGAASRAGSAGQVRPHRSFRLRGRRHWLGRRPGGPCIGGRAWPGRDRGGARRGGRGGGVGGEGAVGGGGAGNGRVGENQRGNGAAGTATALVSARGQPVGRNRPAAASRPTRQPASKASARVSRRPFR